MVLSTVSHVDEPIFILMLLVDTGHTRAVNNGNSQCIHNVRVLNPTDIMSLTSFGISMNTYVNC